MLVSLRDTHPVVRSYAIVDGEITEEPVEVPGLTLDVPGLDPDARQPLTRTARPSPAPPDPPQPPAGAPSPAL